MAPKRSSTATAGRPSKLARKDKTASACREIANALEIAQRKDISNNVTSLLGASLKYSLPMYKEERHEFQTELLSMAEKTLSDAEAVLLADVAAAEAVVNGGDDEKAKRESAIEKSQQSLQACQEAHTQMQAAKAEKSEAFKATFGPLKEAQTLQKDDDAEFVKVEGLIVDLNIAASELLAPMKHAAASKRQLHQLAKQLKAVELEDSLVQAMELPLAKKPDQRGSFDAVVLQNLDLHISEKKAAFEARLKEAAPAREERAAKVHAAQDAHDAAKTANDTAVEELKAAKEAEIAAKVAVAAAKQSAKKLTSELLEAAQRLDAARQALEDFRVGPLASFNELLGRSAPQPEADEPVTGAKDMEQVADTAAAPQQAETLSADTKVEFAVSQP